MIALRIAALNENDILSHFCGAEGATQVYLNQTEETARSINIKRIFPGEGGEDSGETVRA